jgi:hypothetical protein
MRILILLMVLAIVGCSEPDAHLSSVMVDNLYYRTAEVQRLVEARGHDWAQIDHVSAMPSEVHYEGNISSYSYGRNINVCVAYHPFGEWHDCWQIVPEEIETCPKVDGKFKCPTDTIKVNDGLSGAIDSLDIDSVGVTSITGAGFATSSIVRKETK